MPPPFSAASFALLKGSGSTVFCSNSLSLEALHPANTNMIIIGKINRIKFYFKNFD
jgi:hypothetical protein